MTIVDLFAGPGGWSEGLRALGCSEIGIELDEAACKTARAAGHKRLREDVSALSPSDFAGAEGLIASPPCQAWSMAGKRGGERDKQHVIQCARDIAAGDDTRWEHREACEDARSILVVEPLRWALAIRPTWIAFEQVPPVLELWTLFAQILRREGYNVWAGVLEAERYGVPQTRERAILMAHRDRPVHPPVATHQRYVPGQPQRHDVTLEGEVLPWVSMADALGWDGGWVQRERSGDRSEEGFDPAAEPCQTLTSKARSWHYRNGNQSNAARRPVAEPAPTLHFGHALNSGIEWTTTPERAWTSDRPATNVNCDPRISPPGRHDPDVSGSQQEGAIRVTETEAAILQSFRPDYPWQGSRTKRFEQIGNAVPPLLAEAVLRCLVDVPDEMAEAA